MRPVTVALPTELTDLEHTKDDWGNYRKLVPGESFAEQGRIESPGIPTMSNISTNNLANDIMAHQMEHLKSIAMIWREELRNAVLQFQDLRLRQLDADIKNKALELETRYKQNRILMTKSKQ